MFIYISYQNPVNSLKNDIVGALISTLGSKKWSFVSLSLSLYASNFCSTIIHYFIHFCLERLFCEVLKPAVLTSLRSVLLHDRYGMKSVDINSITKSQTKFGVRVMVYH